VLPIECTFDKDRVCHVEDLDKHCGSLPGLRSAVRSVAASHKRRGRAPTSPSSSSESSPTIGTSSQMLFRCSVALALAAHASAYYFFPDPATRGGQHPFGHPHAPVRVTPFPPPRAQALVEAVIGGVSAERMHDDLAEFTAFKTRHAPTKVVDFITCFGEGGADGSFAQTGRESQLWLMAQIEDVCTGPLLVVACN
jgi:hypothetical protein